MIQLLRAAALGTAMVLTGCATGEDSLLAMSPPRGSALTPPDDRPPFELVAPNLLAASGTALLPGARAPALATLSEAASPPLGSIAPLTQSAHGALGAGPALIPAGPLLTPNAAGVTVVPGPSGAAATLAVAPTGGALLNVGGAASVQTAPTQVAVSTTAAVVRTSVSVGGPPPVTAPTVSVTPNPGVLAGVSGLLPSPTGPR